ncbi:probable LRR receptor-like serine/threonine-protein kinase At1g53420 isoform X2 [Pyrus x bretschneideri]|uniref:probable LRR receptor-like serine/threonine-protein kinase At1g53420 isoform X2 n=1 Tax=Pyrus x bretschneideri TaxID=225117 RepID=UPI002030C6B3|nr:probable LRR receptor-like serine/threonine-protein kinase At1g53420 isoform X2 [Pyrus x bretschneideri]
MSRPSVRLQLTKLVFYHILLWQLGHWPQSKFYCRAYVAPLPPDEVSVLQAITRDLEFKQQSTITNNICDGTFYAFTISCNCNDENQCRISKIEINNLGLTGTIHETVGYLSHLTSLSLANNKLHGSIPDTLGNLMDLKYLDLSFNQLSGLIPASLGNLVSLKQLYLNDNLLNGGIPRKFGLLKNLTEMAMQFNMLSGSIPEDFGYLSSLSYMDLSENQLSGPLPESLGSLTSLTVFAVCGNYFSENFPKSYGQLTSLEYFSIAGNYISGPFPAEAIAKWTNINFLQFFYTACRSLMGNYFEGPVREEIFSLPNLQYLRISDVAPNPSFKLPQKIANSANFISLLRNCSITGTIPKYISEEMTSLSYLDLSFNYLTGGLPHYMQSDMIYMSFSGNMLNGTIPRWIFRAFQTKMDLSFNNFSAVDTAVPSNLQLNLFACCRNSPTSLPYMMDPFEMKNTYCPRNKPKYHSLFINCGGERTTVGGNIYDQDNDTSLFYTSPKKNWAYSLSGDYGVKKGNASDYIKSTTRGVSITEAPLYEKARLSPLSLKYYAFCLRKGRYNVTLHFHEIIYTDDVDYTSLRRRSFDVYIQRNRTFNDFNIRDKEGSGEKPITVSHSAEVVHDGGLLEIHLYWSGKGQSVTHLLLMDL